jgi:crotonobetainyl-CoA:carnitine CoA-transferase CaiB-like acyl-CoA transferase
MHALYHRDRTGQGQEIGTAILNACLATSSGTFAFPDGSGPERAKLDAMQLGFNALYRLYETAKGWICLAAVTEDHWARLCQATGRSDLAGDPRFADATARTVNDDDLWKLLDDVFATRRADEWFAVLDGAGVPIEISAPGFMSTDPGQSFLRFSATPTTPPLEAVELGAYTLEILSELGYTAPEIAAVVAETADTARA